jgi:lipid-binding SYLF domain-containing protein
MTKLMIVTTLAAASMMAQELTPDSRLGHAIGAIEEAMTNPEDGIPRFLVSKAQCVVVVPNLMKGAFLFGGKYGRGFATCRRPGGWSSPAAVRIEGGSFGLQLGGSATNVIMLVMNRAGMDRLLSDKFTLGGELAVVEGFTGKDASVNTDVLGQAAIITYSHAKGLFVGLSLEGATLRPDSGENKRLYGHPMNNRQILETRVPAPKGARPFVAVMNKFCPAKGKVRVVKVKA